MRGCGKDEDDAERCEVVLGEGDGRDEKEGEMNPPDPPA